VTLEVPGFHPLWKVQFQYTAYPVLWIEWGVVLLIGAGVFFGYPEVDPNRHAD